MTDRIARAALAALVAMSALTYGAAVDRDERVAREVGDLQVRVQELRQEFDRIGDEIRDLQVTASEVTYPPPNPRSEKG